MRKLLLTLSALLMVACVSQEQILLQKNLMSTKSEIVYLDLKKGFFTLRWQCANPPFKNQPCFKYMEIPIYLIDNPQLGDTLHLTK